MRKKWFTADMAEAVGICLGVIAFPLLVGGMLGMRELPTLYSMAMIAGGFLCLFLGILIGTPKR